MQPSRLLVFLGLILFSTSARGLAANRPIVGDFDSEIRNPEGLIDIDANIRALKDLGANTYFYLIWHNRRDWDQLPEFADAARREGIDIWVYIIPWSETPLVKRSWGYSEPFRTDYIRWAQEIARVSLVHRNIVGFVIDDFYTNIQPGRFTVPYVRQMVNAGKEINPKLKFYPLVYFQQSWKEFVDRYGSLIDGVVAAYPKSRLQIGNALAYLNDDAHGASAVISLPRQPTREGDKGSIVAELRVKDARRANISFYWDDDDHMTQSGYHRVFVKVDGRIIWDTDTSGDAEDRIIELDLSRFARNRDVLRIELGVMEERGVSKYPVRVKLDDIRVEGFDSPVMISERSLSRKTTGPFEVTVLPASVKGAERFKIPMIVMPAGEGPQHEKRYKEPGTARNIAAKTRIALDMMLEGRVEGVVTYCLPKERQDAIFDAVREEYRKALNALNENRRP